MYHILLVLSLILFPSCYKEDGKAKHHSNKPSIELDFNVKNATNKILYVTCFYYSILEKGVRWGWHKSPIYRLAQNEEKVIDLHTVVDEKDADNIYGYLAVFEDENKAHDSIFELTKDTRKIDLDRLIYLNGKKIVIQTEKYGFKGEQIDWDIKKKRQHPPKELDFIVENNTEKTVYVAGFIYQRKESHPGWIFDKTKVVKLKPYAKAVIDVDTIARNYDWKNVRGYLGVFEEKNKQEAYESTFELLKPDQKLSLGLLKNYQDKKVLIIPKKYGALSGFDDRYPYIEFITGKHRK